MSESIKPDGIVLNYPTFAELPYRTEGSLNKFYQAEANRQHLALTADLRREIAKEIFDELDKRKDLTTMYIGNYCVGWNIVKSVFAKYLAQSLEGSK